MEINNRQVNLSISTFTIFKIAAAIFILYILYLIRDILVIFFVSLVLASAISPFVEWMQKKKIPRTLGVVIIYLILIGIVGLIAYLLIPPIEEQLGELSKNFPAYLDKLISSFSVISSYSDQLKNLNSLTDFSNLNLGAGGVISTISGIFGSLVSFFLVLAITFYMAVEENAVKKIVVSTVPIKHQAYIMQLATKMQKKIGLWLRGQLILGLVIGVLTYVGLMILGVKYALVLALVAALTEFIPYLGPILGAVPAVFLAFSQSPMLALFVAGFYYAVQFVENNILVPKIMQKAVGLNPIISIAVLLIGFQLAGIAGAVLSIPVATAGSVLIQEAFEYKH